MAGEWVEKSLGEIIEIKHGFAFKGEFFRDEPPGDVLLTPGNFAIGGGFKAEKFKYYDGPAPDEFVLREGDLLVTMTDLSKQADTLGYPALVPPRSDGRHYLHNQRLGKVVIKDESSIALQYVHYLMCGQQYRHEVLASATGTTVKHTSPGRIKQFRFLLPPLPEQRAIAHILGTLDDKIDLNRQMNDTLEAIARALFKFCFVDSTGNGLPSDWRESALGDVAENLRRGVQADEIESATPYIGLEHMPRRCIALSDWGQSDELESNKFEFKRGEILFGKLRPYFHKVGVAPVDGICSTDILVVVPKEPEWFGFVLGHVSSVEFVNHTDAGSTGTKMPRTDWQDMARYEVALPPKPLAAAFTERVRPLVERIIANIHESRILAALRDTLLPKLISGELRLKDAERLVAANVPRIQRGG